MTNNSTLHSPSLEMDNFTETCAFIPGDKPDNPNITRKTSLARVLPNGKVFSRHTSYENYSRRSSFSRKSSLASGPNSRRTSLRRPSTIDILVISDNLPITNSERTTGVIGVPIDKISDDDVENLHDSVEILEGEKSTGFFSNYAGILLTLVTGLVFTVGGVIVKYMKGYHPFILAFYRFQGILLPGLGMVGYAKYVEGVRVFEPVWPVNGLGKGKMGVGLIFRSVFSSAALFFLFFALQRLDVADTLVIGSCQPVFVTLIAYFFLGEACGVIPVFTALLSIVGVGVIVRPPILTGEDSFDVDTLIGAGFSIASMFAATMVLIIIRYLKDVHVSLLTFVLGVWGTLLSLVCSLIIGEFKLPETLEHWVLAGALAGITLLGQVTMTLALQCEQAGSVAVVRTCDCLFAFLLQFLLFGTVPDWFSLTGACVIIFCVVLTTFRKWVWSLPVGHPVRDRFWIVMV